MGRKKSADIHRKAENDPLVFVLLLMIPIYGGYYTFSVLLCGVCLSVLLLVKALQEKHISLPVDAAGWCLYGICLCNLLSIPLAVSPGMAFVGLLRILVGALFYIYAQSYTTERKNRILNSIAYEGVLLSFLSILSYFLTENDLNGRLDGVFQYANTWAQYQMVCLILLGMKENRRSVDYILMPVLLIGVFLTGSRSAILLMTAIAIGGGILYAIRSKKVISLVAAAAFLLLSGVAASLLSGGMVLKRISQITVSSSSLNGRLLYWKDGLEILKKHPLGIGYGGYQYQQATVQTGIYTVRYIHNEYLQAAMDGGIIAGLLLLALVCSLFLKKTNTKRERVVILAIAVHSFCDFDLQFSAILLLLLFCGSGENRNTTFRPHKAAVWLICGIVSLFFLYFSVVYYCDYRGQYEISYHLYPADLELAEEYFMFAPSAEVAEEVADRIIAKTDLSAVAWQFRFKTMTQRRDMEKAMAAGYRLLLLSRYEKNAWVEFTELLETAVSSERHRELVAMYAEAATEVLYQTIAQTGYLAWHIVDQPDFEFSGAILERLSALYECVSEN